MLAKEASLVCLDAHSCGAAHAPSDYTGAMASFDSGAMLRVLRNRTISFIGDSLSFQLFQQLACLLRDAIDFKAMREIKHNVPYWRCPPNAPYEACRNKFQRVPLNSGGALQSMWVPTHTIGSHRTVRPLLDADVLLFHHGAWLAGLIYSARAACL